MLTVLKVISSWDQPTTSTRPPTDNSDHNTSLGDDTNYDDNWFDDLPNLPVHQNAPHHYDDMSNPSNPDESIDNGNKEQLPATPKGKQRAVGPPTTPRPDRRNSDLEQGDIPVSPRPSNAPHLPQDNLMGLQPRKLGRMRQPPKPHEGDLYGTQSTSREWVPEIGENYRGMILYPLTPIKVMLVNSA